MSVKRETELFDRLSYRCPQCDNAGIIIGVAVNLTYVIAEGFCHVCHRGSRTTFDLLKIDERLHSLADSGVAPVSDKKLGRRPFGWLQSILAWFTERPKWGESFLLCERKLK